ncbi:hypothetical protein B0H10DRAFT_2217157 [Mycena sp. CBHHK59/15]|nr:hypothetical protein B0H10DRAFT_2217157 [Mycena sp. CBHHK59/15]
MNPTNPPPDVDTLIAANAELNAWMANIHIEYQHEAERFKDSLQGEFTTIQAAGKAARAENQILSEQLAAAIARLEGIERADTLHPDVEMGEATRMCREAASTANWRTRDPRRPQTPTRDPRLRPQPTPVQNPPTKHLPPLWSRLAHLKHPRHSAVPPIIPQARLAHPPIHPPHPLASLTHHPIHPPRPPANLRQQIHPARPRTNLRAYRVPPLLQPRMERQLAKKPSQKKPAEHQMLLGEVAPEARTLTEAFYLHI